MNQHPDYQPNIIQARSKSDDPSWWTARHRNHSLTAIFGYLGGEKHHGFRNAFLTAAPNFTQPTNNTIANIPMHIGSLTDRSIAQGKERATYELYQDSIFCPILPGDGPPQKRFFDVIMSGCLPVVFAFNRSDLRKQDTTGKHYHSWWDGFDGSIPKDVSLQTSYPFCKGLFPKEPSVGIDYQSFVVEIHATKDNGCDFGCGHNRSKTCQFDCLIPTLEKLLQPESRDKLLEMRRNLQQAAVMFSYGLEDNSYKSFDAFAVLLTQVGHYLQQLPKHKTEL